MFFLKKQFSIFFLLFFVLTVFLPVVTLAQEKVLPEYNPVCWKTDECKAAIEARKWTWNEKSNFEIGGPGKICGDKFGVCIPAGGQANTEISIGGKWSFNNLGEYFKTIFVWLVGVGGLIAAVLIIAGGFMYMTSAGSSERVKAAKTRISGALMGLFLLLGSYTLLYTINPDLVRLKLPQVYMIKSVGLGSVNVGEYCDYRPESVTRKACESRGNICYKISASDGGPCLTAAKVIVAAGAVSGVVAGGAAAVGSMTAAQVGAGLLKVGAVAQKIFIPASAVFKGASAGRIAISVYKVGARFVKIAASVAVEEVIVGVGDKSVEAVKSSVDSFWNGGYVGICVPPAKDLQKGDMCNPERNDCVFGLKCVKSSTSAMDQCWTGEPTGFCGDGLKGATCRTSGDCASSLRCLTLFEPLDIRACSDGTEGASCESDADCPGKICSKNRCMSSRYVNVAEYGACLENSNCAGNGAGCFGISSNNCNILGSKRAGGEGICAKYFSYDISKAKSALESIGELPEECK